MEQTKVRQVNCEIFSDTDKVIERIEEKIYSTRNKKEKQYYLQDIATEVEVLLFCSRYTEENYDCKLCRSLCHTRKEDISSLIKDVLGARNFWHKRYR